jgi:hypothetical protein
VFWRDGSTGVGRTGVTPLVTDGWVPLLAPKLGGMKPSPQPDGTSLVLAACRLDLVEAMLSPKMVKAVHKVFSVSSCMLLLMSSSSRTLWSTEMLQ